MKTYNKTLLVGMTAVIAALGSANASISFDLQADGLQDKFGDLLKPPAVVVFVADTNNDGFGPLEPGQLLSINASMGSSDDRVLAKFDGTLNSIDGYAQIFTSLFLQNINEWTQGDALGIYWFPDLTVSTGSIGAGDSYGFFSGEALNSSRPWTTPSDGTSAYGLYFFTIAGQIAGGTHLASAGVANLSVAPEPSTALLLAIGLGALWCHRRKRQS